jgi:hypothetical protein
VDARSVERVKRLADDVRSWLAARYGAPHGPEAVIRLVSDPHGDPGLRGGVEIERGPRSPDDPSLGVDDPPTIYLAPSFGSYARPGALARWIFYVEWTGGLPGFLRDGLSWTVSASLQAELHPEQFDATVEGLLPGSDGFPSPEELLDAPPEVSARLVAAATDGGEPALVKKLLEAPARKESERAALVALARANAARCPTLPRLERALETRPRASSTSALLETATPRAGGAQGLPEAASDREALAQLLAKRASSPSADERRLAVYGLGRLGVHAEIVTRAYLEDPSFHVRVAALAALARGSHGGGEKGRGEKALAGKLLDLAKEVPLEEVPGRPLLALALFDSLTGYEEPLAAGPAELSLGLRHMGFAPASYRAIEAREAWLGRESEGRSPSRGPGGEAPASGGGQK